MAHAKAERYRYRLSVPVSDRSVIEWLELQDDIGHSLRHVVKDYVRRHGYIDPTCVSVEQEPRKGRPPAAVESDNEVAESVTADHAVVNSGTGSEPATPPVDYDSVVEEMMAGSRAYTDTASGSAVLDLL